MGPGSHFQQNYQTGGPPGSISSGSVDRVYKSTCLFICSRYCRQKKSKLKKQSLRYRVRPYRSAAKGIEMSNNTVCMSMKPQQCFFFVLDVSAVLDHLCFCTKTHTLYALNLFLKREDLKVFFKKREAHFKISFLKVLKTIGICIKYRQKSWKLPVNKFIFMKVAGIQLLYLLNYFLCR